MTDLAYKDTLIGRLRGPHVNPLWGTSIDEVCRLQGLCAEAANEIERLQGELVGLRGDKVRALCQIERLRAMLESEAAFFEKKWGEHMGPSGLYVAARLRHHLSNEQNAP